MSDRESSVQGSSVPRRPEDVVQGVEQLLLRAVAARASDIHVIPSRDRLQVLWRLDGVLHELAEWPASLAANVLARLKVLAELLTYRTDVPQEGRLRSAIGGVEIRLSTFPTLHGEKGVLRLFVGTGPHERLEELHLPTQADRDLRSLIAGTQGCIVISGPAGSGKTTTAYACLKELLGRHGVGRSLVTLEDPVEAELLGVSQTPVNRPSEFTYALGLRSLMRQDPDVILVGEIRDRETAEIAFQASLTGHLIITTFHAGSSCQAITRLLELGVEPYLLQAGLRGVLGQRLLRRICLSCSGVRNPVSAQNCAECWGSGYRGRFVIAESLRLDALRLPTDWWATRRLTDLETAARMAGMIPLPMLAEQMVQSGQTTPAEVLRVFGELPIPAESASA